MIKCKWNSGVEIKGTMDKCLAEYGVLSEHLIKSAPKIHRCSVANAMAKVLRMAVKNALEEGEENEELE